MYQKGYPVAQTSANNPGVPHQKSDDGVPSSKAAGHGMIAFESKQRSDQFPRNLL